MENKEKSHGKQETQGTDFRNAQCTGLQRTRCSEEQSGRRLPEQAAILQTSREKKMKPLVIYHANCTDGYGAAFAAWLKLGDEAEYLPMQYGFKLKDMPEYKDRDVYMLDFSWSRALMDNLFHHAKRVVWLDHHASVFEDWGFEPYRVYDEEDAEVGIQHHVRLDNDQSGAMLAWRFFHPNTEVPMLIQYIDDRDRWQWKLESSAEIHAVLASYQPWSFEQWCQFLPSHSGAITPLIRQGRAILRAQKQHVERMAKQARECLIQTSIPGQPIAYFKGIAVNALLHQSELGHELANASKSFGLVWYLSANGCVRCSLRSNGNYDVSAIAKAFGGGGHRNAAGFETDIETLMGWLK